MPRRAQNRTGRASQPRKPIQPRVPNDFRAEQQRRAAEAARRRAQAQQRRKQAEQQARIQEQRRKSAAKARTAAIARRRRVKHTVSRGEGAEQIAKKYRAIPEDIAKQTTGGLKAGQVLDFQVPDPIRREKEYSAESFGRPPVVSLTGAQEREQIGVSPRTGEPIFKGSKEPGSRAQGILDFANSITTEQGAIGTNPRTGEPIYGEGGEPTDYSGAYPDTRGYRGKGATPGQTAAYDKLAVERGQRVYSARLTWMTLDHVWKTGEWELRPKIIDPFTLSQVSLEMQQRLIDELGYYIDEEGYARRKEFQDEGYGMGEGYGAGGGGGGYGAGGGGGGGAYEEPTYTKGVTSGKGGATGVRTKREAGQLRTGYNERTSWRI